MYERFTPGEDSTLAEVVPALTPDDEYRNGLDLLRVSWPSLVAEHGVRLRELLDGVPQRLWQSDPWLVAAYASGFRSVGSDARSAAEPYFDAALTAAADSPAPVRGAIQLHYAAFLRTKGRLDDAVTAATLGRALTESDTGMSLGLRVRLVAKSALQLGILRYHLGDFDAAESELRTAIGLAGNLSPDEQLEAHGTAALVRYASGDFTEAERRIALARRAAEGTRLLESQFGAAALIAELLIAVEQDRSDAATELAPIVQRASDCADWEPLGRYALATVSLLTDQHVDGLDWVGRSLQACRQWHPRGMIVTLAEGLRATLLLRLGQTAAAWDILGELSPTQHHANCPARFIAHLRFVSGDNEGALDALRECIALGEDHSDRTSADVLLLTAAARLSLGDLVASDIAFDRSMRIAARNGIRIPFRLVPDDVMRRMIARALGRPQPPDVLASFDDIRGAVPTGGSGTVRLSSRERDVVRSLMHDQTVPEMAESMFISVNTVKSHVKSVYRKLGVSTRTAAVERARELGLHL